MTLEHPVEIADIRKTAIETDIQNAVVGVFQQINSVFKAFFIQIGLKVKSQHFLEQMR